jgi:hypothetical protein
MTTQCWIPLSSTSKHQKLFWMAILCLTMACAIGSPLVPPRVQTTPTPQMVYNTPGDYPFTNKCLQTVLMDVDISPPPFPNPRSLFADLTLCVTNVHVASSAEMTFTVEYTLKPDPKNELAISRPSEAENPNVSLTDDKGNRYTITRRGDCAAKELTAFHESVKCVGSFDFPAAMEGARSFQFHYSNANATESTGDFVVQEIILSRPA